MKIATKQVIIKNQEYRKWLEDNLITLGLYYSLPYKDIPIRNINFGFINKYRYGREIVDGCCITSIFMYNNLHFDKTYTIKIVTYDGIFKRLNHLCKIIRK